MNSTALIPFIIAPLIFILRHLHHVTAGVKKKKKGEEEKKKEFSGSCLAKPASCKNVVCCSQASSFYLVSWTLKAPKATHSYT